MQSRGFIALISVLVLSVILLAAVISLAQYGISSRYALLDLENKTISEELARSCVQVARIAVFNDNLYETTNHIIPVGDFRCEIKNISANTPYPGISQFEIQASSSGATTNLVIEIEANSGNILLVEEVPTF